MKVWLLDGNVLVALMVDTHIHHVRARAWFRDGKDRFATTISTQGTFLRVHMVMALDRSAAAAWRALDTILRHPRHKAWEDTIPWSEVPHRILTGPKQVTDARLAELARRNGGWVLTLDSAMAGLHPDVVRLLP